MLAADESRAAAYTIQTACVAPPQTARISHFRRARQLRETKRPPAAPVTWRWRQLQSARHNKQELKVQVCASLNQRPQQQCCRVLFFLTQVGVAGWTKEFWLAL